MEGEASARSVPFTVTSGSDLRQSCERLALTAMQKPGGYLLTVRRYSPGNTFVGCKLARATP